MPITYTTQIKNDRLAVVLSAIGSNGVLEICSSAYSSVLSTIELNTIAGVIANGVLTFSGFPKTDISADATGMAAVARIRTGTGGQDVITGLTVGLSSSDIVLDSLSVTAGQIVTINSAIITHS